MRESSFTSSACPKVNTPIFRALSVWKNALFLTTFGFGISF